MNGPTKSNQQHWHEVSYCLPQKEPSFDLLKKKYTMYMHIIDVKAVSMSKVTNKISNIFYLMQMMNQIEKQIHLPVGNEARTRDQLEHRSLAHHSLCH